MNQTKKIILSLAVLGASLLFLLPDKVSAAVDEVNLCNPPAQYYGGIRDNFFKSIRETAVNHLTSATTDFAFNAATGTEMSTFMGCTAFVREKVGGCAPGLDKASGCTRTADEICEDIYNQYRATGSISDYQKGAKKFAAGYISGSMLGVGQTLENTLRYEPIPVNYAFFFKDYARRLPIVSETAFAQVDYSQPLVNEVFGFWKMIRNLAYGAMAIVVMVVGIMITMRRKISQQVVVNIQYALPKLVISMILITFSYPIGAAISSFAWALYNSADTIVDSLAAGAGLDCGQDALVNGTGAALLVLGVIIALFSTGIGFFISIFVVLLTLVIIIMWIAVLVKAFFIYAKMLIWTIIAPIMFVFGAIPGNDDQIVKWFKKMGVYGASLFGMGLAVQLTQMLAAQLLLGNASTQPEKVYGLFYVVMLGPLIALIGLGFAFKIPNMIEETIMGKRR